MDNTTEENNMNKTSEPEMKSEEKKSSSNTKRIAKNTLMLYFRQILIMLVSLYTVRVVLNVLGAEDYGIYNVVAGVVTMFGFLSNSMATASQRYFSFDLGKGDTEHLKTTFSVTFQIYLLLIVIVLVVAETLGLWFVNHKLVIPAERLISANIVYQAALFSFSMTLITTPYMASIIAHEKMTVYAYVSIVEVVLKLLIVFLLKILAFDKLGLYGILLAFVSFVVTGIYRFYCLKHFSECRIKFITEKKLFKEITAYSGWNLFGASVGVVKNQITNIFLNLYFGPVVNAARSIASQVNAAVTSFSNNFSTAVRPQIIKSYAADKKDEMLSIMFTASRFTFFLMFLLACPICFNLEPLLGLWLKTVPDYTVLFTRLILIDVMIESISYPLGTGIQATGKIKWYQIIVGSIYLLNLPISLIFLKFGYPPEIVFYISICITFIALVSRLFFMKYIIQFKFLSNIFLSNLFRILLVTVVVVTLLFFFSKFQFHFIIKLVISYCIEAIVLLFIGLRKNEFVMLRNKIIYICKK